EIGPPARVLAQHPADMREPEAAPGRVGVLVFVVHVQVVCAVPAAPGEGAVLQRHGAEDQEQHAQAPVRLVSAMRPQPVVARSDCHAVGNQEKGEDAEVRAGEPVGQPIPGHQDCCRQGRQNEHQGVRPDQGRLGLVAGCCGHAFLRRGWQRLRNLSCRAANCGTCVPCGGLPSQGYDSQAMYKLPAALLLTAAGLIPGAPAQAASAYVSNEDDGTVTVVAVERLEALASIEVGKRPRGMVLSRDGKLLYVALSGSP